MSEVLKQVAKGIKMSPQDGETITDTCVCRGDRTRTCDSLVPNQERYQLRYASMKAGAKVQNIAKSEE